jgi:hypothetical protein
VVAQAGELVACAMEGVKTSLEDYKYWRRLMMTSEHRILRALVLPTAQLDDDLPIASVAAMRLGRISSR